MGLWVRHGFAPAARVPADGSPRPLHRGMSTCSSTSTAETAASSSDVKALAQQVAALSTRVASLEAELATCSDTAVGVGFFVRLLFITFAGFGLLMLYICGRIMIPDTCLFVIRGTAASGSETSLFSAVV